MLKWFKPLTEQGIKDDERYKNAQSFRKGYMPDPQRNYDWVFDHAVKSFDDATSMMVATDRKAETLIRYLAPSTGLLNLWAAWLLIQSNFLTLMAVCVGLGSLVFVLSVAFALAVIRPMQQSAGPSIEKALNCADYPGWKESTAKARYSLGIDDSTLIRIIAVDFKGRRLQRAYGLFILGLLIVAIGMLCSILSKTGLFASFYQAVGAPI